MQVNIMILSEKLRKWKFKGILASPFRMWETAEHYYKIVFWNRNKLSKLRNEEKEIEWTNI